MVDRLEAVRALVEEMERDARRVDSRDAERDAAFAKAARDGELGPHWRALQRRIDEGRTSHLDIISGADTSPEAAAVREAARTGLGEVRRAAEQAAGQPDAATPGSTLGPGSSPGPDTGPGTGPCGAEDPLASTRRAHDDLQARVDAVRRHLGER